MKVAIVGGEVTPENYQKLDRELNRLIEEKGIFAEMTKDCALVFLFSPFNTDEDLDALYSALASIKKRTKIPLLLFVFLVYCFLLFI